MALKAVPTIPLPSSYDAKLRECEAMAEPVRYERELQEGYAREALDDLRMHLTTHATLESRCRKQISGV